MGGVAHHVPGAVDPPCQPAGEGNLQRASPDEDAHRVPGDGGLRSHRRHGRGRLEMAVCLRSVSALPDGRCRARD